MWQMRKRYLERKQYFNDNVSHQYSVLGHFRLDVKPTQRPSPRGQNWSACVNASFDVELGMEGFLLFNVLLTLKFFLIHTVLA